MHPAPPPPTSPPTPQMQGCFHLSELIPATVLGWYLNLIRKREIERIRKASTVSNIHFNARHLYSPYVLLKCSQKMHANPNVGEAAIQTRSPAVPEGTKPVSLG